MKTKNIDVRMMVYEASGAREIAEWEDIMIGMLNETFPYNFNGDYWKLPRLTMRRVIKRSLISGL